MDLNVLLLVAALILAAADAVVNKSLLGAAFACFVATKVF